MSESLIVAILSFLASLLGTISTVLVGVKLMAYRIEQLEKKVEKHNNVVERTLILENQMTTVFEKFKAFKEDVHEIQEELHHS